MSSHDGVRCRIFAPRLERARSFQQWDRAAACVASSMVAQDLKSWSELQVVCRMALADHVCTLWINPTSETAQSDLDAEASVKAVTAFAFRHRAVRRGW